MRRIENIAEDLEKVVPGPNTYYYALDPAVRYLWIISHGIFWSIILIIFMTAFGIGFLSRASWAGTILYVFLFLIIPIACHMSWPLISYKHWGITIRETEILVRSGVIWKRVIAIPFARIQHVDSHSGPLERSFGLSNLVVHTAGAYFGTTSVPGLPIERAEALRDYLSKVGHTHANI